MNELCTTPLPQTKDQGFHLSNATPETPSSSLGMPYYKNECNTSLSESLPPNSVPCHHPLDVSGGGSIPPTLPINHLLSDGESSTSCWKTPTHTPITNTNNVVAVPSLAPPKTERSCHLGNPNVSTPPNLVLETPKRMDSALSNSNPMFLVGPTSLPSKQFLQENICKINLWDDECDNEEGGNTQTGFHGASMVEFPQTRHKGTRLQQKHPRRKPTVSSSLLHPVKTCAVLVASPESGPKPVLLELDEREDNERPSVSNSVELPTAVPFF